MRSDFVVCISLSLTFAKVAPQGVCRRPHDGTEPLSTRFKLSWVSLA